jgi:hypothetical protein
MLGNPMNATRAQPTAPRYRLLALGLPVALALTLAGCVPAGAPPAAFYPQDGCGATASCEEPGQLAAQVRLDTDAMLAGMAHARARMGLQEDATP